MIELQHRLSKAYIVIFKSLPSVSWTPPKSDLPLSCNGFFPSISLPCVLRHPFCPVHPRHPALFIKNRSKFQRTASIASAKAVATPSVKSVLAIMAAERTGKSVSSPPDQSLLPQTDTHPSKPVDPRRNALFPSDACLSQSRLFKACVCAFYPSSALLKPSWHKRPSKPPYPAHNAHALLRVSPAWPKRTEP